MRGEWERRTVFCQIQPPIPRRHPDRVVACHGSVWSLLRHCGVHTRQPHPRIPKGELFRNYVSKFNHISSTHCRFLGRPISYSRKNGCRKNLPIRGPFRKFWLPKLRGGGWYATGVGLRIKRTKYFHNIRNWIVSVSKKRHNIKEKERIMLIRNRFEDKKNKEKRKKLKFPITWNLRRFLLFQPGTRCQSNRKCESTWNRRWNLFWRPVQLLLQLRRRIVSITHFINQRIRNYLPSLNFLLYFFCMALQINSNTVSQTC